MVPPSSTAAAWKTAVPVPEARKGAVYVNSIVPSGSVVKILNRGSFATMPPLIVPPADGEKTESTVTARRELAGAIMLVDFDKVMLTSATLVPFARSLAPLGLPGLKNDEEIKSPRINVTLADPMRRFPALDRTGVPAVSTPASWITPVPP